MLNSFIYSGERVKKEPFHDIEGHKNENSINRLLEFGIINGSNGNFFPEDNLTKEQFLTMLYRYLYEFRNFIKFENITASTDFESSEYAKSACRWAVINGFVDDSFNGNDFITKNECLNILYKVFTKYNVLSDDIGFSNDAKVFLDTINKNYSMALPVRDVAVTLAQLIDQYDFSESTLDRINNTFSTLFSAKVVGMGGFSSTKGKYMPGPNIIHYTNNKETICHELIHAFTSDFNNSGFVGFGDLETGMGTGITEALTEITTREFTDINVCEMSYFNSANVTKMLLESLDSEKVFKMFVDADYPGLVNYLTDIYSTSMSREDAYKKALEIITRIDIINSYDKAEAELDMNYVKETIQELRKLLYISKGVENTAAFNYYENILLNSDKYVYYRIGKYYFNKDLKNDHDLEATYIEASSFYDMEDITAMYCSVGLEVVPYIVSKYPELIKRDTYSLSDTFDSVIER